MSRTTGPILAVGAVTVANESVVHGHPVNWRTVVATGVAAGMFALAERVWEAGAVALSYLALATILLVRTDPKTPSPVESFQTYWRKSA